jgi:predicted SAM-dependent methyltransferase
MDNIIEKIKKNLNLDKKLDLSTSRNIKINFGCGNVRQPEYINIDTRHTEAVDIVATLPEISNCLEGQCSEVYLSHVLEHFGAPGKKLRQKDSDVLGVLLLVRKMLVQGGIARIAVPDFNAICKIYMDGVLPLYPKLLGRLCGEQEYPENLHKCVFDRQFLEFCLSQCGFEQIQNWDPEKEGFEKDSSFDRIGDVVTSLNLTAVAGSRKKKKSVWGKLFRGKAS